MPGQEHWQELQAQELPRPAFNYKLGLSAVHDSEHVSGRSLYAGQVPRAERGPLQVRAHLLWVPPSTQTLKLPHY
jgi:hypothetical protein